MLSGNNGIDVFRCFFYHLPYFLVYKYIFDDKGISQWEHHIPAITCDEGMWCPSTRIELFYFDDNFRRIAQWVLPFGKNTLSPTTGNLNVVLYFHP